MSVSVHIRLTIPAGLSVCALPGCPSDVHSVAQAELTIASKLIQQAGSLYEIDSDAAMSSLDTVFSMMSAPAAGVMHMNFEEAVWLSKSAFLRRRITLKHPATARPQVVARAHAVEENALTRLTEVATAWTDGATKDLTIRPAHAAAVLTGIGRHLLAEMRSRLNTGDDESGWDELTLTCYTIQEQAKLLVNVNHVPRLHPSHLGDDRNNGTSRAVVVMDDARLLLDASRAEFLAAIGQGDAVAVLAADVRDNIRAREVSAHEAARLMQVLNSPPMEPPQALAEVDARMKQIEMGLRDL